jgi:Cysteine dioxygenase type I
MSRALLTPAPATLPARAASRATGASAVAVALALRADLWAPLVEFRSEARWTHRLAADQVLDVLDPSLHAELPDAEVWLLSWLPGQGTDLHDHGASAGAFAIARGTLTERVVARGRDGRVRQHPTDLERLRVRFFGPHYVHQVTNTAAEPAVSVHVYVPGLTVMNLYRIEGTGLVRTATEREGTDW